MKRPQLRHYYAHDFLSSCPFQHYSHTHKNVCREVQAVCSRLYVVGFRLYYSMSQTGDTPQKIINKALRGVWGRSRACATGEHIDELRLLHLSHYTRVRMGGRGTGPKPAMSASEASVSANYASCQWSPISMGQAGNQLTRSRPLCYTHSFIICYVLPCQP